MIYVVDRRIGRHWPGETLYIIVLTTRNIWDETRHRIRNIKSNNPACVRSYTFLQVQKVRHDQPQT